MASFILIRKFNYFTKSLFKSSFIIEKIIKRRFTNPKETLSFNEAVDFLQNKIHIKDVRTKLEGNRLDLLTEITKNFNTYIPFQNLTALAVPPKNRCLPDFLTIRNSGLRGEGGLPYTQAVFSNWLLTALGFNSHLVASKIGLIDRPYNHCTTVARDVVKDGDLYLVEVGAGFPTFEPVPLHDLPKVYKHAFLEFKFVPRGDEYFRLHRVSEPVRRHPSPVDEEGWQIFYHFEDTPRDEEFLAKYHEKIYTEPGYAADWHLMGLMMSLYPKGKIITMSDRTLRVWQESKKTMTVTDLPNDKDLRKAILKNFPMLKSVNIKAALKHWKTEVDAWKLKEKQEKK